MRLQRRVVAFVKRLRINNKSTRNKRISTIFLAKEILL